MSLLARAALVLCTLFLLTSPIYAKENELKARHRVELINDVSSLITEYYFFADVGEEIVVLVNEKLKRQEGLAVDEAAIEQRSFLSASVAGDTAVAAMNFLANSSAIIFGLRQNGGGDPTMIQLLSSYLFARTKHLNSLWHLNDPGIQPRTAFHGVQVTQMVL